MVKSWNKAQFLEERPHVLTTKEKKTFYQRKENLEEEKRRIKMINISRLSKPYDYVLNDLINVNTINYKTHFQIRKNNKKRNDINNTYGRKIRKKGPREIGRNKNYKLPSYDHMAFN